MVRRSTLYSTSIEKLGLMPGMLGVIFKGARCDIHNPALLKQLIVNLIDKEDWMSLPVDVKGTIYEELLQRSASESTKGAGQYFTTRAVIQTMVEVMQPTPSDSICDPAAGTGGFLFTAYNYVLDKFAATWMPKKSATCARIWSKAWNCRPRSAACAR